MLLKFGKTLGTIWPNRRFRASCVLMLCLAGAWKFAAILDAVYPIRDWLFWQLAILWAWVGLFNFACLSLGQSVLVRVLKLRYLPALESAILSIAIGVVGFVLAMYLGGALAWYGWQFAIALPIGLLAICGQDGLRLGRRLVKNAGSLRPGGFLDFTVTIAGGICVGIVYLGVMTPDALNYDSTWYHLTVSQDYARAGRIVPFPADYNKNFPQLAALIHTWGWLLPGLNQPLRWMLALHNEFALFLWTLAGVSAGVRTLLNGFRARGAWVFFFLFPAIFVYDHNLGGAADHICAFFAIPILLATLRVCSTFSPASSALVAITCAGAILTKYQSVYLIVPVALVIAYYWTRQLLYHALPQRAPYGHQRLSSRDLYWSPAIMAGLGALLISPHFIRLAVFYHNPFYPFMQDVFTHSTPTMPNAAFLYSNTVTDPYCIPRGTPWQKLMRAVRLFATFSFKPHYSFFGEVPVFGSLFTLLFLATAFIRNRARLWTALIIASGALLIWGAVYNVDRNLQVFTPVIVCVTGALIVEIWRLGWLARLGLIPLVALQIVWSGDAPFYGSNPDAAYPRLESAIKLIRSGFEGHAKERFSAYRRDYLDIGKALPKRARVLLHSTHPSLGVDREIWLDWIGFQALIHYDQLHTPRELYDYYRKLGITHLLYIPESGQAATKQEEVLWHTFISRFAKFKGAFGVYRLYAMPSEPPPPEPAYRIATLGLNDYRDGVYPIDAMTVAEYLPPQHKKYPKPPTAMPNKVKERNAALSSANAVFVGTGPPDRSAYALLERQFYKGVQLPNTFTLFLKR